MSGKPYKITESPSLGRHLIALRPIPVGEVIIDEDPIVSGPVVISSGRTGALSHDDKGEVQGQGHEESETEEEWVCISCCKRIRSLKGISFPCDKCRLPQFCSDSCTKDKVHRDNECQYLTKRNENIDKLNVKIKTLYNVVLTLRCLNKEKDANQNHWRQIESLQSKVQDYEGIGVFTPDFMEIFISLGDDPDPSPLLNLAKHCLGALRTNAFSVITSTHSREGLYFLSSFMSHSCLMNTDRQIDPISGRMVTRAARRIEEGEVISTSYLSPLDGTDERQRLMREVWLFTCTCPRCRDKDNEMGSYLSTKRCPECGDLAFCPSVEEGTRPDLVWNCTKCGVSQALDLKSMKPSYPSFLDPDNDNLEVLESFLEEKGDLLHRNHSIFTQIRFYLAQTYGRGLKRGLGDLKREDLLKKVRHCEDVLEIMDKVLGKDDVHGIKGVIYFELWCSLRELKRREEQRLWANEDHDHIDTSTPRIEDIRLMAVQMLRFCMPGSPEHAMFKILTQ